MMKALPYQITIVLLFSIAFATLNAQEISTKYGKVTQGELAMTTYEADTAANAVVIYSKGRTTYDYLHNGFRVTYEIEKKIKILKAEGTEYADIVIPYYENDKNRRRKESVVGLEAIAYNLENGKTVRTKMKNDYVFRERVNENYMHVKFSIPTVKSGTVIEYKYKLLSDYIESLDPWVMQEEIPVMYSNYEITIPEYFLFNLDMRGAVRVETKDKTVPMSISLGGGDQLQLSARELTFTGKDIPALKADSYLWYPDDYKVKIGFELSGVQFPYDAFRPFTTTWEKIDEQLLEFEDFGKLLKMRNPFRDQMAALNLDGLSQEEKIARIFIFLKQNISWNEQYGLTGQDVRKAVKEKTGSNADLNFILMSMLRDAGINTVPVIMSRRNRGILPLSHPSLSKINTFVVGILNPDGTMDLIDGSVTNGCINILPPVLMSKQARIVSKEGGNKWTNLSSLGDNQIKSMNLITIHEDGHITGERNTQYVGQFAANYRREFKAAKDSTEFVEKSETEKSIKIDEMSHTNLRAFTPMLTEKFTFTKQLDTSGDYIYFNPLVFKHMSENPFTQEKRDLPIEFPYPYTFRMNNNILIPDGFEIDELPQNTIISLDDDSTCKYIIQVQDNRIMVMYQFSLSKTFTLATDYEKIRTYFGAISEKSNEMIVLKRKAE